MKIGNASDSKIEGIGDIDIENDIGCNVKLQDVRYVPDLRINLISGIALDDEQGFENQKRRVGLLTKRELEEIPSQELMTMVPMRVKFCTESLGVDS
ncbi:hypothetical protein LWI29_000934 [Acer saccharum]|uniref:Retrovirus-related Pol polyprotein from transposon TNT 1-94-like beta-barrel domain-containing protein n=1 Tax=Acer saccharum TaxID=4024 RepID=A0AA39STL6_ACESA|nr:hypothetical protein LWI29_000934 [Acer saccharum]